jgi:hypothetical protein
MRELAYLLDWRKQMRHPQSAAFCRIKRRTWGAGFGWPLTKCQVKENKAQ